MHSFHQPWALPLWSLGHTAGIAGVSQARDTSRPVVSQPSLPQDYTPQLPKGRQVIILQEPFGNPLFGPPPPPHLYTEPQVHWMLPRGKSPAKSSTSCS